MGRGQEEMAGLVPTLTAKFGETGVSCVCPNLASNAWYFPILWESFLFSLLSLNMSYSLRGASILHANGHLTLQAPYPVACQVWIFTAIISFYHNFSLKTERRFDKVQFQSVFLPAWSVKIGTLTLFTLLWSICMLRDSQRVELAHRYNSNVHQAFRFHPGLQTNQLGKQMGSMHTRSIKKAADTCSFHV